jgi:hypothetical protein
MRNIIEPIVGIDADREDPDGIPSCGPQIVATWQDAWIGICSTCRVLSVVPEGFHLTNDGVRPDDGRSFVNVDSASAISSVEADAVEAGVGVYPNPIPGREVLTMRYPSTGAASVVVTDR